MINDTYGLEAHPWEKQDSETAPAYAAFVRYRDLGYKRTLRQAAMLHYDIPEDEYDPNGGKIRNVERWSALHRWVARAEAFDNWQQQMLDATSLEDVRAMKKRQAQIAVAAQNKVVTFLTALSEAQLSKMTPLQAMQVFDLAVKNERLARDVPDSITGITNAQGQKLQVEVEVDDEALERKLQAWMAARDSENDIEAGEPKDPVKAAEISKSWPTAPEVVKPLDPDDEAQFRE